MNEFSVRGRTPRSLHTERSPRQDPPQSTYLYAEPASATGLVLDLALVLQYVVSLTKYYLQYTVTIPLVYSTLQCSSSY